jgi:hypothetical protein
VTAVTRTWPGTWVQERLDLRVRSTGSPVGIPLHELVGLAVRRNPRRAHLLVSTVLGKHVPADPRVVHGTGLLLGRLVRAALTAVPDEGVHIAGDALRRALAGDGDAAESLVSAPGPEAEPLPPGTVVLGFAETATALGHSVADALAAPYLHSTRRPVAGVSPVGGFEEEHSHATSHLLLPDDPGLLAGDGPLVLVDDELSTGTTALNTIRELHRVSPRRHYVIASLLDMRADADHVRMAAVAAELGATIEVVALAAGGVDAPPDVLESGQRLVAETSTIGGAETVAAVGGSVHRVTLPWPTGLRDGARHGFGADDARQLDAALPDLADTVASAVAGRSRVHVLGFEELMYLPLRLGVALTGRLPAAAVTYSTTTRSPVLAVDDPGYAIRSRLAFPSHDDPADGPGERYAYNLTPSGHPPFDAIVLVVDTAGDTPELTAPRGLLDALASAVPHVVLVVVPQHLPAGDGGVA